MYHGAVDVPQDVLNDFLQTAQTLEVKGLAEGGTNKPKVSITISICMNIKVDYGSPVVNDMIQRDSLNTMHST